MKRDDALVLLFRCNKGQQTAASLADIGRVLVHALRFLSLGCRSRAGLAAESLFLRKQLALYAEAPSPITSSG